MNTISAPNLLSGSTGQGIAKTIEDRLSQELVIALVGPVSSGVSTAAEFIREILQTDFDYDVAPTIKPSDIIREEAHRVGFVPPARAPLHTYILEMQNAGNSLSRKIRKQLLS